jgi:hypothetical protein
MDVVDRFVIGLLELGERHNHAQSGVLQTKNTNPNQQQDSTMMNTNSTKQLKNKDCGSKGYRTAKSV